MAREDNFLATEKQLKYQFNKWDLKKYISDQDLTTMLSFKRKREEQGKNTGFMYRDHLFEQERLERASKRRKGPLISSPVLPPYITALVSPRQTNDFLPLHTQTSAPPSGAEAAIQSIESPNSLELFSNNPFYQYKNPTSSDMRNSLDSFHDPAFFDNSQPNQENSGFWGSLLDKTSVSFSPRCRSHMPTPPRQDVGAWRMENPRQLMPQSTRVSPDNLFRKSTDEADFILADMDLDFDFSMFEISPRRPSTASKSPSHEEPNPRASEGRISISPHRLMDRSNSSSGNRESYLVSRKTSQANQALGPVTAEDLRSESIASLLMMLKTSVFPAFSIASQKYEYGNSVLSEIFCLHHCEWLCLELEDLLDSYLEGSLRSIRKRRTRRNPGSLPPGSDAYLDERRRRSGSSDDTHRLSRPTEGTVATRQRPVFSRCCYTPIGVIRFQVRESSSKPRDEDSQFMIYFMPRAMERTLGLCATFSMLKSEPTISPHIETFNVIPRDSLIFEYIRNNDLAGVRRLFDLGAASARDVDDEGVSLLSYAVQTGYSDIFRLLLQGGASLYKNDYTASKDIITFIWKAFASSNSTSKIGFMGPNFSMKEIKKFDQCMAMTQLALDKGCSPDDVKPDNRFAGPMFQMVGHHMGDARVSEVVDVINYLTSIGWPLEQLNSIGQTPLLFAVSECMPAVAKCLRTLIERGARLSARDEMGRGPLISALSPPPWLSDWVYPRCILSETNDIGKERYAISSLWYTEHQTHTGDYLDGESEMDPPPNFKLSIPTPLGPSFGRCHGKCPYCGRAFEVNEEQPSLSALSDTHLESDTTSCTEESIREADDNDYVNAIDDEGYERWIRNPVHVLKARARTSLRILLEAGCDPNDIDDDGRCPSDYAWFGLWPQWHWALKVTGYTFDEELDRWVKRDTPAGETE